MLHNVLQLPVSGWLGGALVDDLQHARLLLGTITVYRLAPMAFLATDVKEGQDKVQHQPVWLPELFGAGSVCMKQLTERMRCCNQAHVIAINATNL